MKISLCMIVKNEEKHLGNCLASVMDLADEINIVDTGSSDSTEEIAKNFGANVFDFKWINDFSAARNFSFSKASPSMDYIMWLDADDIIKKEDYEKFLDIKKNLALENDVIYAKYNTAFDCDGKPTFSYYRERIIRRGLNAKWIDRVHEYLAIPPGASSFFTECAVSHNKLRQEYSKRNLEIYMDMEKNNEVFTPRNTYYFARELKNHGIYEKSLENYKSFLYRGDGWLEDNIGSILGISEIYEAQNKLKEAINILYKSFEFDLPRGEVCYALGRLFIKQNDSQKAIFWLKTAANLNLPATTGFINHDCYGLLPLIELSVIYYNQGQIEEAKKYHQCAKAINSGHPLIINNDPFFK